MSLSECAVRPWNGITFWSRKCHQIPKSSPKWVTCTSRNRTSSKPCTSIRRATVTTRPRSMWSRVWACITPSKICSRRLSSISNAPVRFNQKKSNGNSWSPHATEEWIFSTRLSRSTRRSTRRTRTTLTACEVLFRSGASLAWSTTSSRKNLRCWIVKRKPRDSTSMLKTSNTTKECAPSSSRALLAPLLWLKLARCPIWTICQVLRRTNARWEAVQPSKKRKTCGTRPHCSSEQRPNYWQEQLYIHSLIISSPLFKWSFVSYSGISKAYVYFSYINNNLNLFY